MVISLHLHSDVVALGDSTTRVLARPKGVAHGGRLFLDRHQNGANDDALVAAVVRDAALRKLAAHPFVAQTIEIWTGDDDLFCLVEDLHAIPLSHLIARAADAGRRLPSAFGFLFASALAQILIDTDPCDVAPAVLSPEEVGILPDGDVVLLPMRPRSRADFIAPEIAERRYRRGLDTRVWAIGRLLRVLLSTSEEKDARPKVSPSEVEIVRPILVDLLSPRRSRRPSLQEAANRLAEASAALVADGSASLSEMLSNGIGDGIAFPLEEVAERKGNGPAGETLLFSFADTDVDAIAPRLSSAVPSGMTSAAERRLLCGGGPAGVDARATMDGSVASPFSSMASRTADARSAVDVDVDLSPPQSAPKTVQTTAIDLAPGSSIDDESVSADDVDAISQQSVFDASAQTIVTELGSHSASSGASDDERNESSAAEAVFDSEESPASPADDPTSVTADAPRPRADSLETNVGVAPSRFRSEVRATDRATSDGAPSVVQTEIGAFAPGLLQTQAERPSSRSRSRSRSASQPRPPAPVESEASRVSVKAEDNRTPEDVFASAAKAAAEDSVTPRDEPTLLVDPAELGHGPSLPPSEHDADKPAAWTNATNLAPPQSLRIDHKPHRAATAAAVWGRSTGGDVDSDQVPALDRFAPFPATDAGEESAGPSEIEEDVFAPTPIADDVSVEKTEVREPAGSLTTSMTAEFVMSQEAALKVREAAAKALEDQRARVLAEAEAMRVPQIDPSDPWEEKATLDGSVPVELPNALVGRPKPDKPPISPALHPSGQRDQAGKKGPSLGAQIDAAEIGAKASKKVVTEVVAKGDSRSSKPAPLSMTESGAIARVSSPPSVNASGAVLPAPQVPRGQSFADEDDGSLEGTQTTSIVRARSAALRSQAGSIDVFRHVSEVLQEPAQVSRLSEPPPRDPTHAGGAQQPSYEIISDEEKGVLVVEARAGATVFLDGIWRGVGRVVITELDRFSSYSVRVHCPGFAPWSGSVSLGGEVAARVRPTLEPR